MEIIALKEPQNVATDVKLNKIYLQFRELLNELRNKDLPPDIIASINENIEQLNTSVLNGNELRKSIKQQQTTILKQVEKNLKMVPKSYYRNMWMLFGMSGIGLPIGVIYGVAIGNMGLLGIGLPIGMFVGIVIGSMMDKKALKEGRQLQLEIRY